MNNQNIKVIEKDNQIIAQYVPGEEDFETNFYETDQLTNFKYSTKKTSILNFILYRWLRKNWLWVALAVGAIVLFNKTIWGKIFGWLGGFLGGIIANTLNFSVYTTKTGQSLTIATLLIGGYLAYFTLFHLVRIPHLLREQWHNDKLQAEKELLRRIQEYRQTKILAYQNNQKLHDWANKLLAKQVLINQETKDILRHFFTESELKEENLSDKLFSALKQSFAPKKETNWLLDKIKNRPNNQLYE